MSDFLSRLVARTHGAAPLVRPFVASRHAPGPEVAAAEPAVDPFAAAESIEAQAATPILVEAAGPEAGQPMRSRSHPGDPAAPSLAAPAVPRAESPSAGLRAGPIESDWRLVAPPPGAGPALMRAVIDRSPEPDVAVAVGGPTSSSSRSEPGPRAFEIEFDPPPVAPPAIAPVPLVAGEALLVPLLAPLGEGRFEVPPARHGALEARRSPGAPDAPPPTATPMAVAPLSRAAMGTRDARRAAAEAPETASAKSIHPLSDVDSSPAASVQDFALPAARRVGSDRGGARSVGAMPAETPPVVQVHIGAIEVRAVFQQPPAAPAALERPAGFVSLDHYLKRPRGGAR